MTARHLVLLAAVALTATGCEAIATIFQAGIWVGVLGVLLLVALIGLVFRAMRR